MFRSESSILANYSYANLCRLNGMDKEIKEIKIIEETKSKLKKTALETKKEITLVSSEFTTRNAESFIYLERKNINQNEGIPYKIHLNFSDNAELAMAWDSIISVLISDEFKSVVSIVKVLQPDYMKFCFDQDIKKAIRLFNTSDTSSEEKDKLMKRLLDNVQRRLTSTQITIFILESSLGQIDTYVHLVKCIEDALAKARIHPLSAAAIPEGDEQLGVYSTLRLNRYNNEYVEPEKIKTFEKTDPVFVFINHFIELYKAYKLHEEKSSAKETTSPKTKSI